MRSVFVACAVAVTLAAVSRPSQAQTVYEPVQYQYGQHQEIYYGGRSPLFTSNNYIYTPAHLQTGAIARRYNASVYPYPSPYTQASGVLFSPYNPSITISRPVNSFIFSDYLPYEEVGQFGYTIDDARNEAYSNVPRYQTARSGAAAPAERRVTKVSASAPHIADPREKALPLLDWAKVERTKNPPLYQALLQEARKYDPAAVNAFEKGK